MLQYFEYTGKFFIICACCRIFLPCFLLKKEILQLVAKKRYLNEFVSFCYILRKNVLSIVVILIFCVTYPFLCNNDFEKYLYFPEFIFSFSFISWYKSLMWFWRHYISWPQIIRNVFVHEISSKRQSIFSTDRWSVFSFFSESKKLFWLWVS